MAELYLGMARARLGPAAALIDAQRGAVAACEENRLTRARQAPTLGPPELAIAALLQYLDRTPADIANFAVVEDPGDAWAAHDERSLRVNGHEAHAAYAFHSSGFKDALVLVCEVHEERGWSIFQAPATGPAPPRIDENLGAFPIARIYGQLTEALGMQPMRDEHLVEALARAGRDTHAGIADLVRLGPSGVSVDPQFGDAIRSAAASGDEQTRKDLAASVQRRLGECLVELLRRIAPRAPSVCLSGGLFFNTYFTTLAATCGAFEQVHVPPHPGRNGTALGASVIAQAQGGSRDARAAGAGLQSRPSQGDNRISAALASPYLGPGYSNAQIKEVLDNCKLSYDYIQGDRLSEAIIHALSRGRLVGWFHGRLEWGPRALGHRSVLADPLAPHALDNLNGFLKRRPAYRSYGVSVPRARLEEFFEGPPAASPFMQYEYRPRDPGKFRTILPPGVHTMRVHTVDESEPRFLRLLELWGESCGTPVLVNTSFNGFHEPLVCSARDAIRVFYGTGLDVLALEDFLLRK
jgi:carbamoyltransferase